MCVCRVMVTATAGSMAASPTITVLLAYPWFSPALDTSMCLPCPGVFSAPGVLCGQCLDGMAAGPDGVCVECPDGSTVKLILAYFGIIGLLLLLVELHVDCGSARARSGGGRSKEK